MNKKLLIIGIVCLIAAAGCIGVYLAGHSDDPEETIALTADGELITGTEEPEESAAPEEEPEPEEPEEEPEEPEASEEPEEAPEPEEPDPEPETAEEPEAEPEPEASEEPAESEPAEPYDSPISFSELQAINSDVYAWLEIPGMGLSHAILQNADDDEYYLTHAEDGSYYKYGALFTQARYNSTDFSDPVTIIYGHNQSAAFFGSIQATYSDPETFESCSEAIVYLPDQELHYTVFAAVPYDNRHILYNYDFTNSRMYEIFLDTIYDVRALSANFNEEIEVTPDDQILILSTCLKGDNTQRYLVLMRLDEDTDG